MRKISPLYVIPVVIATAISLPLSYILHVSQIIDETGTPFSREEGFEATVYNVMIFMMMIGIGSLTIYLLARWRKIDFLRGLFLISLLITSISLTEIYLVALIYVYVPWAELAVDYVIILSIVIGIVSVYTVSRSEREGLVAGISLWYGSSAGCLLAASLPTWSVIAIVLAASLYDLYSVFKGPLRRLIELERSSRGEEGSPGGSSGILRGAAVPFKGLHLGLGDVVFYSMFTSASFLHPFMSLGRAIGVMTAVTLGAYATFRLLEREEALPALPIPMVTAVLVYVFLAWILGV